MNPVETLKTLLPEASDEITAAIGGIESDYRRHAHERAFLERAPQEGLLYPGDALKLEDVATKLGEAEDTEQALRELFTAMRSSRPWLFRHATASPGHQKLSEPDQEQLRAALRHGSLTRQIQDLRRHKRR